MPVPDTRDYAFIDGNYFRRAYEDTLRRFCTSADFANIDFLRVKRDLNASKVFYYDSVDEERANAAERKAFLEHIRSLDGFHVQQGTISNRKRQKQVDVQLAVDMLTHSFNKNVWHVSLIAGDLDFKPLVDALINLGIHVHVFYEQRSGAKPLYHAADVASRMTIENFWSWSNDAYRKANPVPRSYEEVKSPSGVLITERKGTLNGCKCELLRRESVASPTEFTVIIDCPSTTRFKQSATYRYGDRERLIEYVHIVREAEIAWEPDGSS